MRTRTPSSVAVAAGETPRATRHVPIACPYCLDEHKLRVMHYEAAPDWWSCPRCAGRASNQLLAYAGLVVG